MKLATYRIAGNPERYNMTAEVVKWFVNEEFERGNKIYPYEIINEATGKAVRTYADVTDY